MTRAMICRDVHNPQARSGGRTALICRNVTLLTVAALRDRNDPRVGRDCSGIRTSVDRASDEYTFNW
jgi:hypothetical protein